MGHLVIICALVDSLCLLYNLGQTLAYEIDLYVSNAPVVTLLVLPGSTTGVAVARAVLSVSHRSFRLTQLTDERVKALVGATSSGLGLVGNDPPPS
jgi:hypothetical protein